MDFFGFHPIIAQWFQSRFEAPTEPQRLGWPSIAAGEPTLIAAPTGSGKTLAAFLSCIDRLLKESIEGGLEDEMRVVYVSPLRALSNDMHRNLEVPLEEIAAVAEQRGEPIPTIRAGLRTGDTTSSQRAALVRRPPHILVTTPESLYLLLTAEKSRQRLRSVETVIVDEIHALVRDKRGSHLALSLERLEALCEKPLQRIGLSATQKPIERMAEFLVGVRNAECGVRNGGTEWTASDTNSELRTPRSAFCAPPCSIIDVGHGRELDLAIEVPPSELGAVCMHEQWAEVYARVVELIHEHRSTLIFVNTRRLAERMTHQLTELLGEDSLGSHHGSLSAERRLKTERRLKAGELKAVVATASLELGLDVGYIDLVIQLGSPRSITTLLQRIGRSGHSLGLVPKGRLFALTRDELIECMALMRAVRSGRLDAVRIPEAPLDVLAQQIVAEVCHQEWNTDELFASFRRAYPYRNLSREDFDRSIEYLSEGISKTTGRSRVYLHHDQVQRKVRSRKGARIAASSNAGAIPETASYRVVTDPDNTVVGSLDEDFAIESMRGDVFLLGNTSWRIQHVRAGDVTVIDAQGAPPTIPFWRGEAPGRTIELSEEVSRLREELELRIADCGLRIEQGPQPVTGGESHDVESEIRNPKSEIEEWLVAETRCSPFAAEQIVDYAAAQKAALGLLPTQRRIVFERFFDETGGMQLVVHAPFGAAINRAWGLAMRKRFCRSFDFELQATADDDGFILSLGPQHSFPIETLFPMLTSDNARHLLEQAVLAVPMFQVRWRWNVTRALLVLRRQNGKKVPPAFQRFRADDLLTAVFPRITGCLEEHTGDIDLPDHPLVRQTMEDCLTEAVDVDGLLKVLRDIERGDTTLVARDTREPSPFCYELLNSNVYAFLDGGEIQERRARAVSTRRSLTVESVSDLGRLDPEAIEQVRRETQPLIRSADELHDALLSRIVLPVLEIMSPREGEAPAEPRTPPLSSPWQGGESSKVIQQEIGHVFWYRELQELGRATTITLPNGQQAWVAAERLPAALAVFPAATPAPSLTVPEAVRRDWPSTEARVAMIRGLIEVCGPITCDEVAVRLSMTPEQSSAALEALEGEGVVLRGRFSSSPLTKGESRGDNESVSFADEDTPPQPPLFKGRSPVNQIDAEHSALRTPNSELQWCHRRLLARIHRLTLQGLRQQIKPVGVDIFLRYLTRHQGLLPSAKRNGPNGLFETISMLQGLDIPAICWERDLLPARLEKYQPDWLDELCLAGEVGWGRLYPPERNPEKSKPMASLTRVAPVSLFLRQDVDWLTALNPMACNSWALTGRSPLSSPAVEVYEFLQNRGAMFAADLLNETRMLPGQLDDVLGELITRGLVTADGFGGLRKLIAEKPASTNRTRRRRRGVVRRRNIGGGAGRWSLWRQPIDDREDSDTPVSELRAPHCEEWAWQLLRRWGVVFRDLLTRETGAPRWFELLQVYRRLEARGEIRGGRFIIGVGGEQFALGDTVKQLRQIRDDGPQQELVFLSAADPLNLIGILTDHSRVPSTASNRVAYLDGVPVAMLKAGEAHFFSEVTNDLAAVIAERFGLTGSAMPKHRLPLATESPVPAENRQTADNEAPSGPVKPRKQAKFPDTIPRPMIS